MLIKGNEIKAVNQYFNKQIAHYRSLLRTGKKDSKGIHQTKRMKRISEKRNRRVKDILHKASRKNNRSKKEGIEVIVVGIMRVGRSVSIWGRRTIRHLFRYVSYADRNDQIQRRSRNQSRKKQYNRIHMGIRESRRFVQILFIRDEMIRNQSRGL